MAPRKRATPAAMPSRIMVKERPDISSDRISSMVRTDVRGTAGFSRVTTSRTAATGTSAPASERMRRNARSSAGYGHAPTTMGR